MIGVSQIGTEDDNLDDSSSGLILGFQDASLWDSALGGFAHATVFAPPGLDFEGEKLDSPR